MSPAKKLNLAVLASGNGTNLQSIIDAAKDKTLDAQVVVVISDNPDAHALLRAKDNGIDAVVIERKNFKTKNEYENEIIKVLKEHKTELVCLAGYMRIVGKELLSAFPDRVINIHPALLPSFPGKDAQKQALDYGVKIAGCTVHFVDEKTDHGPIILQAAIEVKENDTVDSLKARILKEEHRIYPEAIALIAKGKIKIDGRIKRKD